MCIYSYVVHMKQSGCYYICLWASIQKRQEKHIDCLTSKVIFRGYLKVKQNQSFGQMDTCIYQRVLPFKLSVMPKASQSKHFPLVLGLNVMGANLLWKGI